MFSRPSFPGVAGPQKSSSGYWLAMLAGIAAGMTGLWVLGALIGDLFDPGGTGDQALGWRLAIGLITLTGSLLFLVDLERPRSRIRRLVGLALMVVGVSIPTSLTIFLLPIVALGALAFLPQRVDRKFVLAGAIALLVVSVLYVFSGGLILLPLGAVLLIGGLLTRKRG